MLSADDLTKHGVCVYAVVVAASKRARMVNDWRLQRAKVLLEEVTGPKATRQALDEIASGEVRVVFPKKQAGRT